MKTLERNITLDANLAARASRKLSRYGYSLDDAITRTLSLIVSCRGNPAPIFDAPPSSETPGPRLKASFREADLIEAGALPAKRYRKSADLIADCLK